MYKRKTDQILEVDYKKPENGLKSEQKKDNSEIRLSKSSFFIVKKFVVTNCSKERPGSIVTKTLKN